MQQWHLVWLSLMVLGTAGCLAGEGSDDPLLGLSSGTETAETERTEQRREVETDKDAALGLDDGSAGGTEKICEVPQEGLGVSQGSFLDVSKKGRNCNGEMVPLVDLVCGAEAILVDIGAQWCDPCKEEASHLEKEINSYFGDDVVVVSIVTEDNAGAPATDFTCQWWAEEFGLTSPVATDPLSTTVSFTQGGANLPINIILDSEFRILSVLTGVVAPEELRTKLEGVLNAD